MMNKDIAKLISCPKKITPNTSTLVNKIITMYLTNADEYVVKALYDAYKETDVSKIFVIDMYEFGRFLRHMLPIWYKETK